MGTASGHPGETVLVPVHATFDHPLLFLFAPFLFDAERLEYLRYEVEGSEAALRGPRRSPGLTAVSREPRVPRPRDGRAGRSPGDAGPEHFLHRWAGHLLRNLEAEKGDGTGAGAADAGTVDLTWENGDAYDSVRIERNGATVAETAGDASGYRDAALPAGVYLYKVFGLKDGQESFPASTFVSTLSSRGTFLRGDANHDGTINITDPLATLEFLFRGGAALPCDDAADSNDDGEIGLTDPVITLQYLFLGAGLLKAPGTAYAWFDPTPDTLGCGN